jgi:hypothetical protein
MRDASRIFAKLTVLFLLALISITSHVSARDATPPAGIVTEVAPPLVEPSPTPDEPFTASDLTEYADLLLLFSGPDVTPQTFTGQICVQLSVNPPLPSGSWVGTMCESSTPETTTWHSSEYVSLPVSSVYSLTVSSNTSDCTAVPVPGVVEEIDGDNVYGRMEVRIECPPAPAADTFSLLQLYLQDMRGGGGSFYYPGPICIDINVDPPRAGSSLLDSRCFDSSPAGGNWFPPGYPDLYVASTYTATIVSNETGCEPLIQHQIHGDVRESVTDPEGEYHGMILIYLDCLGTAETPEPTVPADATTIPDPTEESASTEPPRPTTGPVWTVVPDTSVDPTSTTPPRDPEPTPVTVIGLPNTGSGSGDSDIPLVLWIAAVVFATLVAGAARRKRA